MSFVLPPFEVVEHFRELSVYEEHYARQRCRYCSRWTSWAWGVCVLHLARDESLPRDELFLRLCKTDGMIGTLSGAAGITGVPFRLAFHPGVFAHDGPGGLSSQIRQAARIYNMDALYGQLRFYAIAIMNPRDDEAYGGAKRPGAVFIGHKAISEMLEHVWPSWPGDMDVYVVHVGIVEEIRFLLSIMRDPPDTDLMAASTCEAERLFATAFAVLGTHDQM